MRFTFPENFLWGVASSAFQMEGGMYEGGKDMNIREAAWLDAVKRGGVQLQDEKEHIGIRNIRDRLKVMVGGTLEIESTQGVGTKVLITIPKEGKK